MWRCICGDCGRLESTKLVRSRRRLVDRQRDGGGGYLQLSLMPQVFIGVETPKIVHKNDRTITVTSVRLTPSACTNTMQQCPSTADTHLGSKAEAQSLLTCQLWGTWAPALLHTCGSGTLRCNSDIVGNKLPRYESCMVKLSTRVYSNVLAHRVARSNARGSA